MICIAGKNRIAVEALEYLLDYQTGHDLCVITNKNDLGVDSWQPSLKLFAQKNNVKIVTLEEIYSVKELFFFSLEYDRIIKPQKFASKQLFNIHFSLLPAYKGMYTSVMPILKGEKFSGVTLHKIDAGIDTGDCIDQIQFPIQLDDNARDVYENYLNHSIVLFKRNLNSIVDDNYQATPQNALGSSYYSKEELNFHTIEIDLKKTAFEVHNQFRAFTFRAYQLPCFKGIKIHKTELLPDKSTRLPGTEINATETFIDIATIDYNVRLYKDPYEDFWKACTNGEAEKIERSIQTIQNVNLRDKNGWNAIILATYNNHQKVFDILLKNGADINATNYKGTSVLMYAKSAAVRDNNLQLMKAIIKNGANINHRDYKGRTVLSYALDDKHEEVIDFLKENGATL
jgi:methionyl-tRNA formyltransferase